VQGYILHDLKVRQGMGLLANAPAIKAIIVSEYLDDPVMLNYADYGFQGALRKSLKREEMKHLVEKVLYE
jgi:DNA-binding NarL/FixJ family response regulator